MNKMINSARFYLRLREIEKKDWETGAQTFLPTGRDTLFIKTGRQKS